MIDNDINKMTIDEIYKYFKRNSNDKYYEEKHCKMLIRNMLDKNRGTCSSFCVEALICEQTFLNWVNYYELFRKIYYFTKMVAREIWEEEGRKLKDKEYQMGTVNYAFDHWKLIGWSRFGISNNSRLKLKLNSQDSPAKHYESILKQAGEGDFTAAEFKQLMEAVNVGINVHQLFELQKQIDELKSSYEIMKVNKNAENPFANKGITKAD